MRLNKDVITSCQNKLVKEVIDIKNNPIDKLFLENVKLVDEALANCRKIFFSIISTDYILKIEQDYPHILDYDYYVVSRDVLEKICDTKTPQGIVSIISFKMSQDIINGKFIVLDNLQDPGNLGTIIRSASGTEFLDICLINGVNPLSQKVVRSSMGGIFRTRFHRFSSPEQFINYAKENNLTFYSCSMEGENVFNSNIRGNYGIVIGNEGNGVSDVLKNNSKGLLSIPMKNGLESLNAGVSLGIIIYHLENID